MNRKNILIGAALLSGLTIAPQAQAFNFFVCNGNAVTWGDPFVMVQNKFSIPVGGLRQSCVDNAIGRWRGVEGMLDMVSKSSSTSNGSTISNGDGRNDVAVANRVNIGGNNGLTLLIHNLCFLSSSWIEADVLVASDMDFAAHVDETAVTGTAGRATFLHELGHAHGLAHSQGFNNMRATQPRPEVGGVGETIDVLPDDAQIGRLLYPSGFNEINLFASAQRRIAGDQIVLNNTGTITVCSKGGNTITLVSTVGNNGTILLTRGEHWWISANNDTQAHQGGTTIGKVSSTTFFANTVNTRQVSMKLPALPVGTFFVFHGVDADPNVTESRKDDNAVREGALLKVISCG